MRIAYIYLPGRIERLAKMGGEEFPTDFFYGAIELRKKGYCLDIFEVDERPRRGVGRFISEYALRMRYLPVKTNTSILDAVRILLPELEKYDVVVATTTGIAFALTFWKVAFRLPFSVIGVINAILNYDLNYARIMLSRFLLNRMKVHLFGEGEFEPICREYGVSRENITVNHFGVDSRFWKSDNGPNNDGYILAVGNDSMRDFSVLLEVARKIDRKILIVTRREIPGEIPDNVHIIKGAWHSREIDDLALKNLYCKAFCIIVPLKESYQPSGQSVTLQAMACEKPVILTNTSGLWDRKHLKHGENVLMVDPGKWEQIYNMLQLLEQNSIQSKNIANNARQYVLNHGRIDFFAERIEQTFEELTKH